MGPAIGAQRRAGGASISNLQIASLRPAEITSVPRRIEKRRHSRALRFAEAVEVGESHVRNFCRHFLDHLAAGSPDAGGFSAWGAHTSGGVGLDACASGAVSEARER
jgi:hypothetical protein